MKREEIKKDAHYMNPVTGSIDTGGSWLADYHSRDDSSQTWEDWGGDKLVEVDENGVEVE